jgi:translocation and assembly module TamB
MTRPAHVALVIGSATVVLIVLLGVAIPIVGRSQWFRDQVRQRIVLEAERATGGRVEIGSFQFDWRAFRAELQDFVIHGTEPPGSPPLVRVNAITIDVSVVSVLRAAVRLRALELHEPRVALIIYPDGHTNVPEPKMPRSRETPIETILDLAIGHFRADGGSIQVNDKRMAWSTDCEDLRTQFAYDRRGRRYAGDLSFAHLHLKMAQEPPLDVSARMSLAIQRNKVTISQASIDTANSHGQFSGTVDNLSSPQTSFRYSVGISLDELARTLGTARQFQGTIMASGDASFHDAKHYQVRGNFRGNDLSLRQGAVDIRHVRADSEFHADPDKIELSRVRVSALDGTFSGRARIDKLDRFRLEGDAASFDVERVAGLYSRRRAPWDGLVSGPVELNGRLGGLTHGSFELKAKLTISPAPQSAPVHGSIDATYNGERGTLDLAKSYIELPATRLDFTGTLAREIQVRFRSTKLDDLLPALALVPGPARDELPIKLENGSATFEGTVSGNLSAPQIAGHLALDNFVYSGEKIDSFSADIAAGESSLRIQNAHLARGKLAAQFAARLALRNWEPDRAGDVSLAATLREASVHDVLAATGRTGLPVTGTLAGQVQVSGALGNPSIHADVSFTKGSIYDEPFDRLTAKVDYANNRVTVANAEWSAAGKHATLSATYSHAPQDFMNGRLEFRVASNSMPLGELQVVRRMAPALSGSVQVEAKGSAAASKTRTGQMMFQPTSLNADVTCRAIRLNQKPVGDLHLTAVTEGPMLTARLEGQAAGSVIRGEGHWKVAGDYSGNAEVTFSKLDLAALEAWVAPPGPSVAAAAWAEGKVAISGPALQPAAWTATLEIPRLEITPAVGGPAGGPPVAALHNSGPVRLSLRNSRISIENAHLVGNKTNFAVTGVVSPKDTSALDLRVKGDVDLAILEEFERDLSASGQLVTDAAIRGPLTKPQVTGRIELKNVNLNLSTLPNGFSNANGVVLFTGNRAEIQNLTAESGGGKVSVTGFALYMGADTAFRLDLLASQVRIRYPEGASTVADWQLNWSGTTRRSLISGKITVLRTGFSPHTDFASLLAQSAQPVRTPAAQTGMLAGVNFDVQVETAADVSFRSALAEQLQAEATLRLRGTPANPVLLGRINITQGQLVFFGNKYTISQGSVSFFNPVKMEPILNMDLQTRARGIDVTLTVSGPVNKLNVSYRSDPPLPFSDIVALLATGRTPTSDPSLAARETGPAQTWEQMGASALVGQAIANPVAGRLQRFFGVSRIKIDPLLTGFDNNPQARLTLEQQVTPDITFTYITNLTRSNPQVIRIEWSLNKQYSIVALREENGLFGLDIYYKKRFK